MKPAYFIRIQRTKVFVTGPLDPVHNKHKFYCQICKTNVSVFSKGAREIVRHYQSEGHLRKDQRWRYEHLGKLDKISGTTVHAVREKDGHILPAFELEKEKPLFETAPLVDISPRFPFYDEYMASAGLPDLSRTSETLPYCKDSGPRWATSPTIRTCLEILTGVLPPLRYVLYPVPLFFLPTRVLGKTREVTK